MQIFLKLLVFFIFIILSFVLFILLDLFVIEIATQNNMGEISNYDQNMIMAAILFAWLVFIFHFIPWYIALFRKTKHRVAIFFLNFFTGWTIIGFVACFIWACVDKKVAKKNT